jgi:gliding motility-associated-like protein
MKMYSAKYLKTLIIIGLIIFTAHFQAFSQTYQVNGAAVNNGNGLVRMTTSQASVAQTASAWNTTKIDLTQPFDMSFEMFFGCNKDPNTGGDGMTFTFHNDPRGLNAVGDNYGFLGLGGGTKLTPAVSIEFDTYDATSTGGGNELPDDHIALDLNGDVNQDPAHGGNGFVFFTGTSGTTSHQAILGGRDLEDCSTNSSDYYTIRVVWNPAAHTLQLYEEGVLTMTYTNDVVNTIFGGNSMVYWGFTGATGSAANEQWIAPEGAIIPWECTVGTSCCAPFTVTPSSPTTICNNPITLSVSGSYDSYSWSDGSTSATTQVSLPGTYTLNVLQVQQPGNVSCPGSATFTITPTGPTATLSGGGTFCNSSQTTPLSVALTGSAPWSLIYSIDGVAQPAVTGIATSPYVFQGSPTNVYSLVSVSDNSGCNSNATGSATVDLYPGVPVGHDDVFTAPGTANLSVDDDGGTYVWYDAPTGGTQVNTGATFSPTPVLNTTTTYYVENTVVTGYVPKSVSLLNKSEGTGNDPNDHVPGLPAAVCYLEFTANSNFILDTITCLVNVPAATTNGRVKVYITPYTGAAPYGGAETVAKDSMNISIGTTGQQNILIPLNYACTAGTTYHISYEASNNIQTEMYFQLLPLTGPNAYPITDDPELSITQYDTGRPGRYPGLFDWKIRVPSASSSCGRTPVTAYTCPKAVLSGDAVVCNDGSTTPLTVVLTGRAPYTLTYAIDGISQTPITGINASPYVFQSASGAHTYTLVSVSNADCNGTVSGSATVTLTTGAPVGHDDNFTAPGTADLSVDDGGDTYEWYDAPTGGNLVHTGPAYTTSTLNATTTYYVNNASIVNTIRKSVSLLNKAEGTGPDPNDQVPGLPPAVCYLEFTANSNFTLDTITCLVNVPAATTNGHVTVYITPYTGAAPYGGAETVAKDSINISIATTGLHNVLIPLHYTCTAGTTYHISYGASNNIQTEMYFQLLPLTGPNAYPIDDDPELSITQYDTGRPGRYPGLFDWKISTISSTPTCGRTPVTAYVCPTAVLSGDAVICDDGTTTTNLSIALTGASPWTFTYAIDGVSQTPVTTSTNPYTFASATGAHAYTLVSVSNATSTGCANGTSGTATVTLNPDAPVGHDATFLPGNAANLSVDNTGGTFNWFTTATGSTSVSTTNTYSPTLTNTTTFYVQQVDVNGDTSCTRTPVTAYLCPTAGLSGNAMICNDGIATTTLSVALDGDAPWSIVYAIDGVNQTAITGINSTTYQFNSTTGAHVYTLVSVSNATSTGCANGASGTATVTVNPDAPTGHDATFLPGNPANLSVDNTGGTFNWFTTATGSTSVSTTDTYSPTLTNTTTFYVQHVDGNGDTSCTRTPVTAYLCPTAALSGNAVICNDGASTTPLSVALTGDSPWSLTYAIDGVNQTAITGITTNPYTITSATGAHNYTLVSVTNATSTGCANGTSGTVAVTVKPDAPVGHDASFTSPGSAILSVDNTIGSTYNWYTDPTAGILVNTGATYTTPTLTTATTYYVEQVIAGETSCTRTPVTAFIFVPTVPLFIPNLMTPNNDGKNDRFEILGLPNGSALGIYNRWGNAIYQSDNYDNQWTAENTSSGVYYYDLKLKNGESYKGWLQIVP